MNLPPHRSSDAFFDGSIHHHPSTRPETSSFSKGLFWLQIVFVLAVLVLYLLYGRTPAFNTLSITFVSIFLEALPFMLLGSLLGGFIEVFVSKEKLAQLLPKSAFGSILAAAATGIVLPVCECAIVPIVRRLFQKGLPLGAGIAFLLAGPIVNPLVFFSTAVAYGFNWSMAAERMFYGYLIAVIIAVLAQTLFSRQSALLPEGTPNEVVDCQACRTAQPLSMFDKTVAAFQHAAHDFLDIGRFLVFGAFIAGVLQAFISRGALTAVLGSVPVAIFMMMGLAIVLNLCSEADAFVAASFRTTLPVEAQMAFMVLGPMLDVKLILMYFRVFKKRMIFSLAGAVFAIVFLMMWIRTFVEIWTP